MTIDDFVLQPRGGYSFDVWQVKRRASSVIGSFKIESYYPPTDATVTAVEAVIRFISAHPDALLDRTYESYARAAKHPEWLVGCGVPNNLGRDDLARYIRGRTIGAHDEDDGAPHVEIVIDPLWNVEHKIHLQFEDGRLELLY